jgi:hypothetical protein
MTRRLALLLSLVLGAAPGFAKAQAQARQGELSTREQYMVMFGVGYGYMTALCNLEKGGYLSAATRGKLAEQQLEIIRNDPDTKNDFSNVLDGMKSVDADKEMCNSEVLPARKK